MRYCITHSFAINRGDGSLVKKCSSVQEGNPAVPDFMRYLEVQTVPELGARSNSRAGSESITYIEDQDANCGPLYKASVLQLFHKFIHILHLARLISIDLWQ